MTGELSPTVNKDARSGRKDTTGSGRPHQRPTGKLRRILQILRLFPTRKSANTSELAAASASSEPQYPLEIPAIAALLRQESKEYRRREDPAHFIEARLASSDDLAKPLETWITDRNDQLVLETVKEFTKDEIAAPPGSIILLRYPRPITTDPSVKYNEWFMLAAAFNKQYQETAGSEWKPHRPINKVVIKKGITIDKNLIQLLGGDINNGRATIRPPWDGSMVIVEGGILTKDGYGIGPKILAEYYEEVEGPKVEEEVR
ncbi:hypothetical protein BDZ91DRAFT_764167 [Kalaharituber pfeilii]|nr:hypothetical protein BDZ91DRAFT_764167 [Kalaharituber pfeilii]